MDLVKKIFTHTCEKGTTAIISFLYKNGKWELEKVEYKTGSKSTCNYSLEDWIDLNELSLQVIKMAKELNREK